MQDSIKIPQHNIRWRIGLNDGTTHQEGTGLFAEVEGGNSSWLELLEYLAKNNAQITSLVLVTPDNREFHLPSRGNNPKFRLFDMAEKPLSYRVEHAYGQDRGSTGEADWYTIGVAVYNKFEFQIWVDENDPRKSYSLIKVYAK